MDVRRSDAVVRGCFQSKRKHFGVGRRLVSAAERLDSGLQEFCGCIRAMTEYRTEITKACRLSREGGSEVVAGHGDREIRTQAELIAVRRGGQVHAPPDVFAGQIKKRL